MCVCVCVCVFTGEVFDYLVAHGRMKEKEARVKFRQVQCTCRQAWPIGDISMFNLFCSSTSSCQLALN